jgi:hypothetical protein
VISGFTASTNVLYLGFAAVAGAGTLGLMLLSQPPPPPPPPPPGGGAPPPPSLAAHLAEAAVGAWRALALLRQPRMLLLLPLFFFSGAELSFWTGEFPLLLQNGSMGEIGFVLAWAGVGEVAGGVLMGRLSDAAGRSAALLLAVAAYSGALALSCAVKSGAPAAAVTWQGSPVAAFAAALLFGVADAGFNATAYAMCSQLYGPGAEAAAAAAAAGEGKEEEGEGGEGASQRLLGGAEAPALLVGGADAPAPPNPHASVGAFSIFQLIQNAGSATWYGVSLWLPLHSAPGVVGTLTQVWLQAALLLLVVVTFVAVDRLTAQRKKAANDQISN